MKPPIFIIGAARSGTTLLCKMLTAHPNIFIKNELPEICKIFTHQRSKQEIIKKINALIHERYNYNLIDFLKIIGKKRWGIKDPSLTYCLNCLVKHFPNAKILFIIRDGRAVASSNIKNKWGVSTNIYYGAKLWKNEVEIQKAFIENNPENCHVVKYENLVIFPENELRSICLFIDEPYMNQMYKYDEQISYLSKNELNKNVFRPLDKKIILEYKKELTPFQIDVFETIAGDILLKNQYELMGKKINIPKYLVLWYCIHQKILGEIQIQYKLKSKEIKTMMESFLKKNNNS